jgi:hypothetical protein
VEGEADARWRANREADAKANDPAFDLHTMARRARRARRAANLVQRRQDLLRGFLRHTGLPAHHSRNNSRRLPKLTILCESWMQGLRVRFQFYLDIVADSWAVQIPVYQEERYE